MGYWPVALEGEGYIYYYYSFKIFPRFGLVETTRIIHHNQLLFTKFGKNLRHIQLMTSKVEPAADYSTVDRKKPGNEIVILVSRKTTSEMVKLKNGEIFWMNNKAIIEFGFRRIWRIVQISEGVIHRGRRPRWITLSLICTILHILRKPNSIIATCFSITQRVGQKRQ